MIACFRNVAHCYNWSICDNHCYNITEVKQTNICASWQILLWLKSIEQYGEFSDNLLNDISHWRTATMEQAASCNITMLWLKSSVWNMVKWSEANNGRYVVIFIWSIECEKLEGASFFYSLFAIIFFLCRNQGKLGLFVISFKPLMFLLNRSAKPLWNWLENLWNCGLCEEIGVILSNIVKVGSVKMSSYL